MARTSRVSRAAPRCLLGAYALATFASFPHPLAGRVVDLGLFVGWLGPALLLLGLESARPRVAARRAFVAGLAAHSAVLHWIYVVTVQYGHAPAIVGWIAPIGLAAYIAAFTAAFGGGWAWLRARRVPSLLAAPVLWTLLEHARSFAATGFPWATLGYSQHQNAALLGLASFTGVYGLSFATVLGGTALAEATLALRRGRAPGRGVWMSIACLVALHVAGLALRQTESEAGGGPSVPTLRMAALQGNISQALKWDRDRVHDTVAIYSALTRRAAGRGARVIVWPETAVPAALEEDPELRSLLSALAIEVDAVLVVGSVGTEEVPGFSGRRVYDSAYVLGADGQLLGRYDKSHLVPFGEYLPLRAVLGGFLHAVARGIASRDVSAGPSPRALWLSASASVGDSREDGTKIGVPICYELLFPDLMRRFAGDGAAVLLAITNDAWYGRTGAPYQFLAMTALRSAESGMWTLRAANTGVSAVIDARGRVQQSTEIFERDLVIADVPLRPNEDGRTFYVRFGDVFAWGCWVWLAILAAIARRRGPQRESVAGGLAAANRSL